MQAESNTASNLLTVMLGSRDDFLRKAGGDYLDI